MGEQRTCDEQQESQLKTERVITTIQDGVAFKVAEIAAQEVDGTQMGGGGTSEAVGGLLSAVPSVDSGSQRRGVSAEVGEAEAAVGLSVTCRVRQVHPSGS